MREDSISRRYASALYAEAVGAGTLTPTLTGLQAVTGAIQSDGMLRAALHQPVVTSERKKTLLKDIPGVPPGTVVPNFLNLLVDKRRIDLLSDIQEAFEAMARAGANVEQAMARTAVPLTAAEHVALVQSLEARTGKKIDLKTEVDPSVIGGVFVRIGDTVYDGTVKGNIDRLRERLLSQ